MKFSIQTEKKWQERWEQEGLYKFDPNAKGEKFYILEMFSYPSGANLHLGHWFNYGPADSYARYKMMKGYNVFHPMGFDAFGLPAENYAIKTGIHPKDSTIKNIDTMRKQLKAMGATYDWDYTVETCMPNYYKWTQWLFLQLFKAGLAYKKEAPVNWCTSCNTVLANEQVVDGHCERCHAEVEKKKLEQWFFKTTEYAQELLDCLEDLDWPEATKKIQVNWIGRSEGAEVVFKVENSKQELKVFTTRADTLFGVTYMVIAPESDLALGLATEECQESVKNYKKEATKITDIERMSTDREKTGVFTGSYAINPVNGEKIPIWVGDYVLEGYGTGAIMAVPAHDDRDYAFAKAHELPIKQVIKPISDEIDGTLPFVDVEEGSLINSGFLDGLSVEKAIQKMTLFLQEKKVGMAKVNYKLKDWLVSRQRYWGAPIPIIDCSKCGKVPVPEEDLPVLLPYDVEFRPDGESPLKKSKEFMHATCPKCGGEGTREADTLDTFVCSSWYFLRHPDSNNEKEAWNKELVNKMLPVDVYIGGKEHAAMHLIYARFMTKAMRDLGFLNFDEPFTKLIHQGMILGSDGNKMSKSKGNTVPPDDFISEYGADVFRLNLMFGFSYIEGGPWKEEGIKSMHKYLSRVEKLVDRVTEERRKNSHHEIADSEKQVLFVKNRTIKQADGDLDKLQFNTAIARLMEFLNELNKYEQSQEVINEDFLKECVETYILLLAPFTPYFAEEQWERLGKKESVHKQMWPQVDEMQLKQDLKEIPVQINGKVKAVVKVPQEASQEEIEKIVKQNDVIKAQIEGNTIKKEIYIQNKIYSIVI